MRTRSITQTTAPKAAASLGGLALAIPFPPRRYAEQPPGPCHPNPQAAQDEAPVRARGDVSQLPGPLQDRLGPFADRPHSQLTLPVYAQNDGASQLLHYYLLDTTRLHPNVFPTILPGINHPLH